MHKVSLSIGVCCSRKEHLLRVIKMILCQDLVPEEVIIVITFELKETSRRLIQHISELCQRKITKIIFLTSEYGNVSKSRNMILDKVKSGILIFIDDDIVISDKYFFRKIILPIVAGDISAVVPIVYPQKCNMLQLFLFLTYHYNLLTNSYWINRRYRLVSEYPISVIAIDVDFLKSKRLIFNHNLISGEDIDLTRRLTQSGGKIIVDRDISVTHYFVGKIFQFIRKIHWYVSGIIISDTLSDKNRYGFIPTRKLQVIFFPLFLFERILTNGRLLSKKIAPREAHKVIFPSMIFYSILCLHIYAYHLGKFVHRKVLSVHSQ